MRQSLIEGKIDERGTASEDAAAALSGGVGAWLEAGESTTLVKVAQVCISALALHGG